MSIAARKKVLVELLQNNELKVMALWFGPLRGRSPRLTAARAATLRTVRIAARSQTNWLIHAGKMAALPSYGGTPFNAHSGHSV